MVSLLGVIILLRILATYDAKTQSNEPPFPPKTFKCKMADERESSLSIPFRFGDQSRKTSKMLVRETMNSINESR